MTYARAYEATKRFGDVVAVDHAGLSVARGEVVGLIGANGAGKTTLIRMLLGLTSPTEGVIELFGETPTRAGRHRVGYVPQGLGLYDDLTVAENLSFVAGAFGARTSIPPGLRHIEDALVRDLPLGQKRRLSFAAALQHEPELLILDEPTSGVDVIARADLWDTIRTAAERGAGVIVTTHHMEEAEECDRLILMAAGRIVEEGTHEKLVGTGHTVVVRSASWPEAFDVVDAAGRTVALVGETLRVPGADRDEIRNLLISKGIDATLAVEQPTLDEVFAALSADAA
jgi:ABC-2 type transport system ATP-binding protein